MKETLAYKIVVDRIGCEKCGGGRTWTVVGPSGVGVSRSFELCDDASDLAADMNIAYRAGQKSAERSNA